VPNQNTNIYQTGQQQKNEFSKEQIERNRNEILDNNQKLGQNPDIFNKLYVDSYRKQNKILLNEEIKKLSELGSCTFKPTIRKYNFEENN
jgi:hypothetical protein